MKKNIICLAYFFIAVCLFSACGGGGSSDILHNNSQYPDVSAPNLIDTMVLPSSGELSPGIYEISSLYFGTENVGITEGPQEAFGDNHNEKKLRKGYNYPLFLQIHSKTAPEEKDFAYKNTEDVSFTVTSSSPFVKKSQTGFVVLPEFLDDSEANEGVTDAKVTITVQYRGLTGSFPVIFRSMSTYAVDAPLPAISGIWKWNGDSNVIFGGDTYQFFNGVIRSVGTYSYNDATKRITFRRESGESLASAVVESITGNAITLTAGAAGAVSLTRQ